MKKTIGYHLALSLSDEERREIMDFRRRNPHIKFGGEIAQVVLAYIRGKIPEHMVDRRVRTTGDASIYKEGAR